MRRCWRTNYGAQATITPWARAHLHPESFTAAHRVMPRLVAMMRTGAMSLSRARLRKEKLSISSMWTSSMNSTWNQWDTDQDQGGDCGPRPDPPTSAQSLTPGMISALPSSLHSATLALICSRTSDLISPVSPARDRGISGARGWVEAQRWQRQRKRMPEWSCSAIEQGQDPGTPTKDRRQGPMHGRINSKGEQKADGRSGKTD